MNEMKTNRSAKDRTPAEQEAIAKRRKAERTRYKAKKAKMVCQEYFD